MSTTKLDHLVLNNPLRLPVYTTIQRNALVSPEIGTLIFNSNTADFEYWTGTKWETATG